MCNGHSTRISQGGSIAVLRPPQNHPPSSHLSLDEEWRLHFFNHEGLSSRCGTQVTLLGTQLKQRGNYQVIIHRDGDLSASLKGSNSSALFSFSLPADLDSSTQLPQRLDLGVGDSGIIGRRVSVIVDGDLSKNPKSIAEGIIGWN